MTKLIDANDFMRRLTLDTSKGHYGEFMGGSEVAFTSREIAAFVEQMPTLTPPNEWISVEDRLPPNMDDVLVVVRDNGECWTATGYYSSMSKVWYAVLNGQDTQMDVLWWMPFPASPDSRPPEGEEDNNDAGRSECITKNDVRFLGKYP